MTPEIIDRSNDLGVWPPRSSPLAGQGVVPIGERVLHAPTEPIDAVTAQTESLAKYMIDVMHARHGIGLAANQVGLSIRMFVHNFPRVAPQVILNPKVVDVGGTWDHSEGCLSLTLEGSRCTMRRPKRIVVEALTLKGEPVRISADELLARVFQHEIDHLDGLVYVQRLVGHNRQRIYGLMAGAGIDTDRLPSVPYEQRFIAAVLDDRFPCHCGYARPFRSCCLPIIEGTRPAVTAEDLMRSRYSAFSVRNGEYLLASWHPRARPPTVTLPDGQEWTGLEVLATASGGALDRSGTVEFIAHYRLDASIGCLHERSRFERHAGAWMYVNGIHMPQPSDTSLARVRPWLLGPSRLTGCSAAAGGGEGPRVGPGAPRSSDLLTTSIATEPPGDPRRYAHV